VSAPHTGCDAVTTGLAHLRQHVHEVESRVRALESAPRPAEDSGPCVASHYRQTDQGWEHYDDRAGAWVVLPENVMSPSSCEGCRDLNAVIERDLVARLSSKVADLESRLQALRGAFTVSETQLDASLTASVGLRKAAMSDAARIAALEAEVERLRSPFEIPVGSGVVIGSDPALRGAGVVVGFVPPVPAERVHPSDVAASTLGLPVDLTEARKAEGERVAKATKRRGVTKTLRVVIEGGPIAPESLNGFRVQRPSVRH